MPNGAAAAVAATLLLTAPGTAATRHVVHLRGTAYEFNNVGMLLGGATVGVAEHPRPADDGPDGTYDLVVPDRAR